MSLISELEEIRASLKACRKAISLLIERWNNGEIDTSSDSDDTPIESSCNCSPHLSASSVLPPVCCDEDTFDLGALAIMDIPKY